MLGTPTIFFDCDDTLVIWDKHGKSNDFEAIKFTCYGKEYKLIPHKPHIEALKKHKNDGYKIVVWSAGGEEWAAEVVKVLDLGDHVDCTLSKPEFYYDDKRVFEFMHHTKRIFTSYRGFGSECVQEDE